MLNRSMAHLATACAVVAYCLWALPANAQTAPASVSSPTPTPQVSPATPASNGPARRQMEAPLDAIFPSADFPAPAYLVGTPSDPGNRAYGWIDTGIEESTSKYSNTPLSYNDVPNRPELDQAVFRVERQPDTMSPTKFDWGYRFTGVYGVDYRYTTMEGVLSNQLLLRNQTNGFDPVEMYLVGYDPYIGQGTVVQLGRVISPPDIEANLAPQNFLYTHSIMFSEDCYTQMGALFTTMLSKYWSLTYGIHGDTDTALWDPSAHIPTFELLARYVSHSNRNSVFFGADAINTSAKFKTWEYGNFINASTGEEQPVVWGHDNLQQFNATWTHVFNAGFQNQFEAYYLYELNAPVGGTINNYNLATGGPAYLGAGGGPGALLPGLSDAVGLVDYVEAKIDPTMFGSLRFDYLNDTRGWRTGFPSSYGSITLGVTKHFGSGPLFDSRWELRPEIRTEKAFRAGITPYDNGTKGYQSTFGMDAIGFFGNP